MPPVYYRGNASFQKNSIFPKILLWIIMSVIEESLLEKQYIIQSFEND